MNPASAFVSTELSSSTRHMRNVWSLVSLFRHAAGSLHSMAALLIAIGAVSCSIAHATVVQRAHFVNAARTLFNEQINGLNTPYGVAVDGSGNVYIADNSKTVIVMETLSGGTYTQSTIGSGLSGPNGVAVDGSGNVYIADTGNNRVLKQTLSGGTYTQSTIGSGLSAPFDVVVDGSGNVYISDAGSGYGSGRVLMETLSGGSYTQSTITSGFGQPHGVAVDGSGNVYVADRGANLVFKETLSSGSYTQTTIANDVVAPYGVAVDGSGNVYIADTFDNRVLIETWDSGTSTYTEGKFVTLIDPMGMMLDGNGNLYIAVYGHNGVVEVQTSAVNFDAVNVGTKSSTATMTFAFDSPGTLGSTAVLTQGATGLDFADAGTGTCAAIAYNSGDTCTIDVTLTPAFSGTRYGAVLLEAGSGYVMATAYIYGTGTGPQVNFVPGAQSTVASSTSGGLSGPTGVAMDGSGNVYIADWANSRVVKETLLSPGSYSQSLIGTGLNDPTGVAVDGSGNVYIADYDNSRVVMVPWTGSGYGTQSTIGSGLSDPQGVAVDGSGNVYIADSGNNRVLKETRSAGSYTQSTIPSSGLAWPYSVAVDGSGNVYIADFRNSRVLKETLSGGGYTESTIGSGLSDPQGVAVDGSGNVYVADTGNNQVLMVPWTASGYGTQGVIVSGLNSPQGLTVDGSGNVYIADSYNNWVVKEDFADAPSLSFAATGVGATSSDSPQTVTVENIGNADLTIPIPNSGSNPSIATGFTLASSGGSACPLVLASASPGTLAAGSSCLLPISFAPVTVGTTSGSLVLTDNHLNATGPAYTTQSIELSGTATQATPVITWATPAAITFGTTLSGLQLDATASVAGTFVYNPAAGTTPAVGADTLSVSFTPTDATDYTTATGSVTLTVNQATPVITWATPAAITFGTTLSGMQLDATASVAGTFVYNPLAGSTPATGTDTLSVTFTPTDATDYTTATGSVTLTVNQATPVITWATPAAIAFGTTLSGTQLNATASTAGTFVYSPAAGTTPAVGPDTLSVTFTPTDAADYTTATGSVTLTVNSVIQTTPTITWATPAAIAGGTALSSTQLSATAQVDGTFVYSPAAGTIPAVGLDTLSVTFTPTDTVDYTNATATVVLSVGDFFNLAVSGSPSQTVNSGAAAVYNLAVTPEQMATLPGDVTFSATGLPQGATAAFSPATITAGSPATGFTLTIQTSTQQAANAGTRWPAALGLMLLPLFGMMSIRKRRQQISRLLVLMLLGGLSLVAIVGLAGCGAARSIGPPPTSYTVVVTATCGKLQQSSSLTLNVQK